MSVQAPSPTTVDTSRRRPGSVWALAALLGLLAVGATQGGWAMVSDPTSPLDMPTTYLERTPISDYFLPGVFFLCIAAASLVTLVGLVSDWRWAWANKIEDFVGRRWPWIGAVAVGAIVLAFEVLELFLVPFQPVMHPLLLAGSGAILLLPFTRSVGRHLAASAGTDRTGLDASAG